MHGLDDCWQKDKQHPGQITCGKKYGRICQMQKKLSWEVFISLIRKMQSLRKPSKTRGKKLEIPMEAAMPCRIRRSKHRETCSSSRIRVTKLTCIVEADESTTKRLEGTLPKDHKDHIAGKGINSLQHYNLVHKFVLMPEAMKYTRCESGNGKRMGKTRANTGMTADEFKRQKRSYRWSKG